MATTKKGTFAHRQREKALREQRQAKLRRRDDRKAEKAKGVKVDDLDGIVPGPQPIQGAEEDHT